jgi:hypothetical protein
MSVTIVGNWQLDEGTGSIAKDSSGDNNDGQLSSSALLWTGGRKPTSTALHFDGENYVKVVGNPPPLTVLEPSTVTVEAWIRSCGPGSLAYILSKGGADCVAASYALYAGESGGLSFYIRHEDQTNPYIESPDAGKSVWNGNWHHVAGTYDGKTVRLYVDGHQIGDGTHVPDPTNILYNLPVNEFFVGSYGEDVCPFRFTGDIAEVRVWDGVLSDSEILARAQS